MGGRNSPTIAYAKFSPKFNPDTVRGGQFHDGRAATLKHQAMGPPLDNAEMMMPNKESVIERIKENPFYIKAFKSLYGGSIFEDINASYEAMGEAIAKFEKTDFFSPFDSKFDRYLGCRDTKSREECRSEGNWTVSERRGWNLFFDDSKTNCAMCHFNPSNVFSEHKYHNIGTPKNMKAIQAKFDLGLAELNATDRGVGKTISDPSKDGAFKTSALRNIAVTGPCMHNSVFKELKTVLIFYDHLGQGNRPINPETGEPWGQADFNETINWEFLKLMPPLSDTDINDLEQFLRTLTDEKFEKHIK